MKFLRTYIMLFIMFMVFYPRIISRAQPHWQQINGALSGGVYALAIDLDGRIIAWTSTNALYISTDDGNTWTLENLQTEEANSIFVNSNNHIFVCADGGRIYRSIDNGISWSLINNGISPNDDVTTMLENTEGEIFIGTKYELMSGDGGGIYKSMDNGESWIFLGLLNRNVYSLTLNSNNHIFAGHTAGISKSTDGGNTWVYVNNGIQQYDVITAIAHAPNSYLFAGSWEWGGGMYRSSDDGQNWSQINNGLPADDVNCLIIKPNGYIFAGYKNSGIFRSTNNGNSWQDVGFSLDPEVNSLDINQSGHIYAATSGGGIYKSISNGEYWDKITHGIVHLYISAITNNLNGDILAGTDGGGVYISSNQGVDWTQVHISYYPDYIINTFATNSSGHIFAGLGGYQIHPPVSRSTNGGYAWSSTSSGIYDDIIKCITIDHNEFLFAGGFQKIWISTNNGGHWNYVTNGLPYRWVFSTAINQDNHIFAGTYGEGIYRSTDYGNSFTPINNGITGNWIYSFLISSSGVIFAGNRVGVFRSTDNGENWNHMNNGMNNPGTVRSLIIDRNGYLLAGATSGFYYSSDNGEHWGNILEGLTGHGILSLSVDSLGNVFAGTTGGVFMLIGEIPVGLPSAPTLIAPADSTEIDSASVLFAWQRSQPEVTKYWLELDTTEQFSTSFIDSTITDTTYLYSALQVNKSYWWRIKAYNVAGWGDFSEVRMFATNIVTAVESEIIPIKYALQQNYPNPFNPVTTIKYQIPELSFVTLKVYDVLGNEIATLINEEKPAGSYDVEFDATVLSSGIYFYRLQAGSFVETKKMVLMK